MPHELTRLSDALVVELGERAVQVLFYENEGRPLWAPWAWEDE